MTALCTFLVGLNNEVMMGWTRTQEPINMNCVQKFSALKFGYDF
jgi:hypothetical protein